MPLSRSKKKIIGMTSGDPCGVGPEVIAKAIQKPSIRNLAQFVIIGDPEIFQNLLKDRFANNKFINPFKGQTKPFNAGCPNQESAKASSEYLKEACRLLQMKEIDGLVTGPVSKEAISSLGFKFSGHTEFLADNFNVKDFAMMFVSGRAKMVIATRHIPLSDVSRAITTELIFKTIWLTHQALRHNFKIPNPKIAVCGLNPHAGEKGLIGREEIDQIIPAMEMARQKGMDVRGPFPADTIFYPGNADTHDVILAMYHDQGLAPIKTLHFNKLVNITIGLPFIRTSPAHGTAFGIAGKNKANSSSMEEAIKLAVKLTI